MSEKTKNMIENFIKTGDPSKVDDRDLADIVPFEWKDAMRGKDAEQKTEDFLFVLLNSC